MQKRVFIISVIIGGVKHYFEHEEMGIIDPKTHATIKEPRGYFSPDVKDACKFSDMWLAEAVSASYEGAQVETIKEGERLK